MRIQQVNDLDENELGMLLFIVNVIFPIQPLIEITPDLLPVIKHEALMAKVTQAEAHVTDEAKPIYQSLLKKLNSRWVDEVIQNANTTDTKPSGSNIQSEPTGVHLETPNTGSTNTTSSTGSEQQGSGSCPPEQNGSV
jgi:hypothetical protein